MSAYGAWPHQEEALARALEQNIILNQPTGSGKTLVACMLLDSLAKEGSVSLFVVNSRALVPQQAEYLKGHSRGGLVVAVDLTHVRAPDVFVATAEVARSALESGQVDARCLACVVLDEAHYATGRHPYAEIIALLRSVGVSPRILGLTASFMHGRAGLQASEKRLSDLEELLAAKVFSPEVPGVQHSFFSVPFATGTLELTRAAAFEAELEAILGATLKDCQNWELWTAVEKEKTRLRGVLEAVGPAGWHGFVCHALPEVVAAKLQSKLGAIDDEQTKTNLQAGIALVRPFQQSVLALAEHGQHWEETTGKFDALLALLRRMLGRSEDKILVFVERVSVACVMARIISARLVEAKHVAGVQGMDDVTRSSSLARFRSTCRIMVSTSSLEEGLDVPACRFVIRYDSFSSAKSHVQGSGRARHPEAEVYYFENDVAQEEAARQQLEAIARHEPRAVLAQGYGHTPPAAANTSGTAGVGTGHRWGTESTMWDYRCNKSFRGMACACGSQLRITSRAYGQGRKKKEAELHPLADITNKEIEEVKQLKHPPREVARVMEVVHLLLTQTLPSHLDWADVIRTVVRFDFLKRARNIDLDALLQQPRVIDHVCRKYFAGGDPLTPDRVRWASKAVVAFFGWTVAIIAGILPAFPEKVGGEEARRRIQLLDQELKEQRRRESEQQKLAEQQKEMRKREVEEEAVAKEERRQAE
ncbi:unnamed protein product, partial [Effrenium voratum]